MPVRFNTHLPANNSLTLQCCQECRAVNYPPRELCGHCLADALQWQQTTDTGEVLSVTQLHYSLEDNYLPYLPWSVGSIKLHCGPVVLAHLQPGLASGAAVIVRPVRDPQANIMLAATALDGITTGTASSWLASINFSEMTS